MNNYKKSKLRKLFLIVIALVLFWIAVASIDVLNVQSYPVIGENWVVEFETKGSGDLSILDYDGTSYSGTGFWTVKVPTEGKHTQQFKFEDEVAYVNNYALGGAMLVVVKYYYELF